MLTDDELQIQLAEAFREQAGPTAGQAVGTDGIFRRGVRRRQRLMAARAASVAAVVAVVAVTASVLVARPATPKPGSPPAGVLLAAAVARPLPVSAADAGLPPYYVVAAHDRPLAEVHSSATGKILTTVPLPPATDPKVSQISAAGNDRTFVLALESGPTRFYQLRVAAGGRSARLTPLPVPPLPAGEAADAIAVSPGGRKLAIAIQDAGGNHGAVEVVTLATGAARTWTTARAGLPWRLSWADSAHELGVWWDGLGRADAASGLWVLDTTAAGDNLLSGRRILPQTVGDDEVQTALLSPDGATAIASVTYHGTRHVARGTVVGGVVQVSARTGHPLRILLAEHAAYSADPGYAGWYIGACELPAIDGSGAHLLVSCDRFGRLDRARFTPLPGSSPQTAVAAAW